MTDTRSPYVDMEKEDLIVIVSRLKGYIMSFESSAREFYDDDMRRLNDLMDEYKKNDLVTTTLEFAINHTRVIYEYILRNIANMKAEVSQ